MTGTNGDAEYTPDGTEFSPNGPRDWVAGAEPEDEVDEQDRFVPPEAGPVLGGDPLLTLAWIAVIAVPVVLIVASIANIGVPSVLFALIVAVFAAGVGVLVWRLPSHRDPDDDDGAVV